MANLLVSVDDQTFHLPQEVQVALDDRFLSGSLIAQRTAAKLTGAKVAVILRHDDVQASALAYLPTYATHGVHASWYVASGGIGGSNAGIQFATADQLRTIAAQGHELGAHGINLVPWSDFTTPEARREQLLTSKKAVEDLVGDGYVCETFAYPGNAHGGDGAREVLEYFLLGTTGVPNNTVSGLNNTAGTLDLAALPAEYTAPLIDPNPALTPAKAQAWFDAQKTRAGVTIFTLQAHNTTEMSVANLDALLTTIAADPQVVVITMRELAHYLRAHLGTIDFRRWFAPTGWDGTGRVDFVGDNAVRSGHAINRKGLGRAYRVFVNGEEVASLDNSLRIVGRVADSLFEKGHRFLQYNSDNTRSVQHSVSDTGVYQMLGNSLMSFLQLWNLGLTVMKDGRAVEFRSSTGNREVVTIDTTRGTLFVNPLTVLPTGVARIGEMCNVNGVVYVCTTGGGNPIWTPIGAQTAP